MDRWIDGWIDGTYTYTQVASPWYPMHVVRSAQLSAVGLQWRRLSGLFGCLQCTTLSASLYRPLHQSDAILHLSPVREYCLCCEVNNRLQLGYKRVIPALYPRCTRFCRRLDLLLANGSPFALLRTVQHYARVARDYSAKCLCRCHGNGNREHILSAAGWPRGDWLARNGPPHCARVAVTPPPAPTRL